MTVLTDRHLNRATLARQMLLTRANMDLVAAVEWLIGLQGQVSQGPYQGLWSRLTGFRHEDLTALIVTRRLLRATSLRSTLHLHTLADLTGLRPHVQPVLDRMWKSAFGNRRFGANDIGAVHRAGIGLLDQGPMTGGALGKALTAQFPDGEPLAKSVLLQVKEILVQIPPTRIWGSGHAPILTRLENWAPPPYPGPVDLGDLVRRYLRAYGPATIADMQAWSGLTRLGDAFAAIREELVTYEAEDGRTLFDLAAASLTEPDVSAPPRFLPLFDNVYLGYADRRRLLVPGDEARLNILNEYTPAVLVDGRIRAGWAISTRKGVASLAITPYHPLRKKDLPALERDGLAFLTFMQPDAASQAVEILPLAP